ncbi:cysteine rich repeat-containing protein [Rhodopila sp.]|uniref:cysteine rich repeat-containing protein n=1 Tax=Rhodopila sp. TaxID=2480087 RepID=UPI003D0C8EF9
MTPVIRFIGTTLLFSFVLCAVAGAAGAQQPSQAQISAIKQSCRSDYQSNCASVPTGGSAALQCLQQHQADLSPACQSAVAGIGGGAAAAGGSARSPAASQATAPAGAPSAMSPRQQAGLMRNACGGDFRAYCRGVRPGGGRAMSCLAANQTRLSASCKGALAQAHAGR